MGWRKVEDEKVRHLWGCMNDACDEEEEAFAAPNDYGESGIPMCVHCDEDMTYIGTEIDLTSEMERSFQLARTTIEGPTERLVAEGDVPAAFVVNSLVTRSAQFLADPRPDGEWLITVKKEGHAEQILEMAKLTRNKAKFGNIRKG